MGLFFVGDAVFVDDDKDGWWGEFFVFFVVELGFGGLGDCAGAGAEPEEGGGGVLAGAGEMEEGVPDDEIAQFFRGYAEAEGDLVVRDSALSKAECDEVKFFLHFF